MESLRVKSRRRGIIAQRPLLLKTHHTSRGTFAHRQRLKRSKASQDVSQETRAMEGENEYYYYYYYEGDEDEDVVRSSNPPSLTPSQNKEDAYYYYYYYEESTNGTNPVTSASSKNSEDYYYYYYYYNHSDDTTDSTAPSSTPSQLDEENYYYYYYDSEVDTNKTSSSPSKEDYYYYYDNINESESPSSTPSQLGEEYYYYYYPSDESNSSSLTPTEDEDYYYYYYNISESTQPSISPTRVSMLQHLSNSGLGNGCNEYLLSPTLKHIQTYDLAFTFMVETKATPNIEEAIAESVLQRVSELLLVCKDGKQEITKRSKGIFLIHFPPMGAFEKVADCMSSQEGRNCMIMQGQIFFASNRDMSQAERVKSYVAVASTIDTISHMSNLKDDVTIGKYLGPFLHIRDDNTIADQFMVLVSVIVSILLLAFSYRRYRQKNKHNHQRVVFPNS